MRNPQRSRRLLPGVYVGHNGHVSDRELDLAASRYGGDECILSGARGLVLSGVHDAPRGRERLILVPAPTERVSREFVKVLETQRLPLPLDVQGVRVAPPARAALDMARNVSDMRVVQVVFSELLRTRKATVMDLFEELDKGPRWGSALPRRVLAGLHAGARSKPELDALERFRASALIPEPMCNAHLYDADADWIACVDFYWEGLVAEIQSKLFHFALHAWEPDETRKARLASHGLLVAPIVPVRMYKDWPSLEIELARSIDAASQNTCRVTVGPPPPWWGQRMG